MNKHWYKALSLLRFLSRTNGGQQDLARAYSNRLLASSKVKSSAITAIEERRKALKKSDEVISVTDFGAGSHFNSSSQKQVSRIASYGISTPHICRLLYAIAQHIPGHQILELGTSLGISASYLAAAHPEHHITTIEGSDAIAQVAATTLRPYEQQITQVVGSFQTILNPTLSKLSHIDLAYIDGHHDGDATKHYFQAILPKMTTNAIVVLDDIYWSEDMTEAWFDLVKHPSVAFAIDYYHLGILCIGEDKNDILFDKRGLF